MSERRLEQLVATLASTRPALNDVARARVAAALAATLGRVTVPPRRAGRARWGICAAVAAAVAVGFAVREHGERRIVEVTTSPHVLELRDEEKLPVLPGGSARLQAGGTTLTLYGPGWAMRRGKRIVVDADALVVDAHTLAAGQRELTTADPGSPPTVDPSARPGVDPRIAPAVDPSDAPVELAIRSATIWVQHATFAVDTGHVVRVTVIRGELWLRCDDTGPEGARWVAAGEYAICGDAKVAVGSGAVPPRASTPPSAAVDTAGEADPAAAIATAPPSRAAATATAEPSARQGAELPLRPAPSARVVPTPAAPPPGHVTEAEPPGASEPAACDAQPGRICDPAPAAIATPDASPGVPARAIPAANPTTRYAAAERLMFSDAPAARAALSALIADTPTAPEAAVALLDIARLAAAAGDPAVARAALDRLAGHPAAAALGMPAAYLRCILEPSPAKLRTCFAGFRAAFPGSPRDADVLARMIVAAVAAGDCPAARLLLNEHTRRYPTSLDSRTLRERIASCTDHGAVTGALTPFKP
jgi:hypothetical protein